MGIGKTVVNYIGDMLTAKSSRDREYDEKIYASLLEFFDSEDVDKLCSMIETNATYLLDDFEPFLNFSEYVERGEANFNNEKLQEAVSDFAEAIDTLWDRLQRSVLPARDGEGFTFNPRKMDREVSDEVADQFPVELEEIVAMCGALRDSYRVLRENGGDILGI